MRNRPHSDPVDPTPPLPRGASDFEEAQIKRDFIAVFAVLSKAMFHSFQESYEYAYRAGFIAGKSRRESSVTIGDRKMPSYIKIL